MPDSADLSALFSAAAAAMFFYAGRRLKGRPEQFWLAAGCALLALVWASQRLYEADASFGSGTVWIVNTLATLGTAIFACGMLRHLGVPPRPLRWLTLGLCSVTLLLSGLCISPLPIPEPLLRLGLRCLLSMHFLVIALAALWAQRREPGLGHVAVGLTTLAAPLVALPVAVLAPEYLVYRSLGIVPFMLMVLAVLPAGYIREQRRLAREQAVHGGIEAELRDRQAVLQVLGDASPDGWSLLDASGRALLVNAAMERLLGLPREELLGHRLDRFFQSADQAWLRAELVVQRHDPEGAGATEPPELTLRLPGGVAFPVRAHLATVQMSRQGYQCLYLIDVRPERTRTEALASALIQSRASGEAKTRFLATMSHEIRTPLSGLSGMLDLLGKSPLTGDQRSLLSAARGSARHLRSLLNDLLDMSKIEAGRLELEDIAFDLRAQLEHVLDNFGAIARARGLSLEVSWNTPQALLSGDPHRIVQVLSNLLDNAVKFTDHGGIHVQIRTARLDTDDDLCALTVSVSDTGTGVPADRAEAVFEPFTQADPTTARLRGGTGLGLSLCSQLCRQMGGDVALTARPGGGSTFSFSVVCGVAYGAIQFDDTQPSQDIDSASLHDLRVLIVDDNSLNQMLLKRWLRDEGMRTVSVGDGAEALKAVCSQPFDVVLMDISMPVMNGIDATRAIRAMAMPQVEESTRFAQLPIIGVSAHAMSGDRERCLACGMNDYVTKPIDRMTLLDRITRALGHGQAHVPGTR